MKSDGGHEARTSPSIGLDRVWRSVPVSVGSRNACVFVNGQLDVRDIAQDRAAEDRPHGREVPPAGEGCHQIQIVVHPAMHLPWLKQPVGAAETTACVYLVPAVRQWLAQRTAIVFGISGKALESVFRRHRIDAKLTAGVRQDREIPKQAKSSRRSEEVCRLAIAHVWVDPVKGVCSGDQGEPAARLEPFEGDAMHLEGLASAVQTAALEQFREPVARLERRDRRTGAKKLASQLS